VKPDLGFYPNRWWTVEYLPHHTDIDEELEENNFILEKRVFGNFVEYNSIIFIDS